VADGVVHQVVDRLAHAAGVDCEIDVSDCVDREGHLTRRRNRGGPSCSGGEQLGHVGPLTAKRRGAVASGEQEQGLGETGQAVCLLHRGPDCAHQILV